MSPHESPFVNLNFAKLPRRKYLRPLCQLGNSSRVSLWILAVWSLTGRGSDRKPFRRLRVRPTSQQPPKSGGTPTPRCRPCIPVSHSRHFITAMPRGLHAQIVAGGNAWVTFRPLGRGRPGMSQNAAKCRTVKRCLSQYRAGAREKRLPSPRSHGSKNATECN